MLQEFLRAAVGRCAPDPGTPAGFSFRRRAFWRYPGTPARQRWSQKRCGGIGVELHY